TEPLESGRGDEAERGDRPRGHLGHIKGGWSRGGHGGGIHEVKRSTAAHTEHGQDYEKRHRRVTLHGNPDHQSRKSARAAGSRLSALAGPRRFPLRDSAALAQLS